MIIESYKRQHKSKPGKSIAYILVTYEMGKVGSVRRALKRLGSENTDHLIVNEALEACGSFETVIRNDKEVEMVKDLNTEYLGKPKPMIRRALNRRNNDHLEHLFMRRQLAERRLER